MSGAEHGRVRLLLGLVGLWFLAAHLMAVFTENVNWDEFALLQRVADMLRSGQLQGGGRPGVAELVLAPFVRGCVDTLAAVQSARLFWTVLTTAAVVALYLLMLRLGASQARPHAAAALAVALLVLALPFLRWSIQVRTDQLALAFGLWSGLALIASRQRPWLAALAGLGFGAAFLCSQKATYLGVLCGLLAGGQVWAEGSGVFRREARVLAVRAVLFGAGFAVALGLYRFGLPLLVRLPEAEAEVIGKGFQWRANYLRIFGTRLYTGMALAALPHLALVAMLALATARAVRQHAGLRRLAVSWTVLGSGLLVSTFHSGMFPYFWMTLGLFPAVALAYSLDSLVELVPPSKRRMAAAGVALVLLGPALPYSARLLEDTQGVQREVFRFIEQGLPPSAHGFQLEGALFCRPDPAPFPILLRDGIEARFRGPKAAAETASFLERFVKKPVSFVIVSHMSGYMPGAVRNFWAENYLPYLGPLHLAGRRLKSEAPRQAGRFSLIVAGQYHWIPLEPGLAQQVTVDGAALSEGTEVALAAGSHEVAFGTPADGLLVLATPAGPRPLLEPFYAAGPLREIRGAGYWGW